MAARFFLWPQAAPPTMRDLIGAPCPSAAVESRLRTLFPGCEPVLFSSARAGLSAVLQTIGLSRPDLLWTPRFSSHCVLEAIAHVCTPTPCATGAGDLSAALVYHQWGHRHEAHFPASVRIIEDAVDSLLLPGQSPFATTGDFLLWSLPKVLGTQSGGVVFCRLADEAKALRALRNGRPSSALQAFLRWRSKSSALASRYWNGAEALEGELVEPLRRQVLRRLGAIDAMVEERLSLLAYLSPDLRLSFERDGLLPSNLPLSLPADWERVWGSSGPVSSGLRSFNAARSSPGGRWVRVAPLPVHIDVSTSQVQAFFQLLNLKVGSNEFNIV